MTSLLSGLFVMFVVAFSFWSLLPRGGKRHRWVDTEWEPYISVAICGGVALSFTMILSAVLDMLGKS